MSVRLYDEAFMKKLQRWTKDTAVTILGPSEMRDIMSILADKNDDNPIQLPLVTLKRSSGISLLNTAKRPITHNGLKLAANPKTTEHLNAIPISISYELNVYCRYREELDEYIRNFVFNIINYPRLDVIVPYEDKNLVQWANIRLDGSVDDSSQIPERLALGQFVRATFPITVDDAYLFDIKYDRVKRICITGVEAE